MDPGRISESLPFSLFPMLFVGVISVVTDFRTGKIRNWVTFSGMASGAAACGLWSGWAGFGGALAGIVAAFLVFLPLYLFRILAAGDVKLLMAFSAWGGGPRFALETALLSVLLGGVVAFSVLLGRRRLGDFSRRLLSYLRSLRFAPLLPPSLELDRESRFAFAFPLSAAAAWTLLAHPLSEIFPLFRGLP